MISRMIGRKKKFLRIAAALLALLVLFAAALFFFPQPFLCVDSGPVKADVIIVLGGGGAHERPVRAAELFNQHAASRIIVSGAGDDEINRRALIRYGVPASAIEIEGLSRTTRQNAMYSVKMLRAEHVHSAIIVTSWYHSRRAFHTFDHFGKGIKFYSCPSHFWYDRGTWSHEFTRQVYLEFIKIPGYWVAYGVCPF
ncbi:MAG TPA: YdcF family protein [Pseudomonadales bacterium]|nr:YdcF family protein [Pseudomonadales bacterium]